MLRALLRRRGAALSLAACAALCLIAGAANAYVPPIDGHLTDPGHRLKSTEKDSLEDQLGKIQSDTQVDCAGWVMQSPTDEIADLGREAYDHWRIGRDWENGVLFVFPVSGPAILIQNTDRPALTPTEVSRVLSVDAPGQPLAKRVEHDANEVGAILRVGSKAPKPRPPGIADPRRGHWFAAGTAIVGLAAIVLSMRRRRAVPIA
jgi:hypothetical protein